MQATDHPIQDIWHIQLKLLDRLLLVCQEHNLKIWADSGTLLGAIRHKGFIPWDDDIDLAMMRDDYDKLVRISAECFTPPYFFQTAYSENVPYPRGHAQLRMDGTTAILPYDIDQNFHQGIFIDIFPLDNVPDNLIDKDNLIHAASAKLQMMQDYAYTKPSILNHVKNMALRELKKEIDSTGFKSFFASYEDLFRATLETENGMIGYLSFDPYLPFLPKRCFEKTIMVPFEDHEIPAPAGYDIVLTQLYGDYMTPVKSPSMHGEFAVLDSNKSYTDYLPKLRKQRRRNLWEERFNRLFKGPR